MKFLKTLVAATASIVVTTAVHATPIVNTNDRPVTINTGSTSERSLQTVLDQTFGTGEVNAGTDQSTAGMWGSATGVPSSHIPTLMLEATSGESTQTFGIWFGNDTSNIYKYELLGGTACAYGSTSCGANGPGQDGFTGFPTAVSLQMNYGRLLINNTLEIVDARINPMNFGFYFGTPSTTAYSIDSITGGSTRFLAYQGGTSTNWLFAFEDGSDFDYNDMVVKVESIKVPEPASLALLGLGLAGVAAASRRKAKKA